MNAVWDLGRWSLSEQWDYLLRLRFTSASILAAVGVLLAAAAFLVDCRRRENAWADRPRLLLFTANAFSLLLLCWAGDSITFYFAWFWLVLSSALLNPRDSSSDGIPFVAWRWAPALTSQVSLLIALVLLQGMLRATDWVELQQRSAEIIDPSSLRITVALTALSLAAWLPFLFLPARRDNLWTGFQLWPRYVAAPASAGILLWRVSFLGALQPPFTGLLSGALLALAALGSMGAVWRPAHRLSLTAFGLALGAVLCGFGLALPLTDPWPLRGGMVSALFWAAAAVRLGPAAWKWTAPEEAARVAHAGLTDATARSWRRIDRSIWDGLCQVPVRICHAVGGAFVYWQGNSAQYTLVVILIGTLLLFWAALKTQVIW